MLEIKLGMHHQESSFGSSGVLANHTIHPHQRRPATGSSALSLHANPIGMRAKQMPQGIMAVFLCCLRCSFDSQALALAPDSQVPQQFGGGCHKTSATNIHWADFCVSAMLFGFSKCFFSLMPPPQNPPRVW